MVKIVIENLAQKDGDRPPDEPRPREIIVNDPTKPLLRLIQESGVDWMTDCGGKGRCTTCKAIVLAGAENLTPVTPAELKYRRMGALHSNERLTCQVRVKGDITIRVPEEFKLPHMKYS